MNHAIIVAAGRGERMSTEINKILMCLDDKPIIVHAIEPFEECKQISDIVVVCNKWDINDIKEVISKHGFKKVCKIIEGGKERQDSVYKGIKELDNTDGEDIVLIHNGANPFADSGLVLEIINTVREAGAAVCGYPAENTIKEADSECFVRKTLQRKDLWEIQTPQGAKYCLLREAFDKAYSDNFYGTDDATLIERAGYRVRIVRCRKDNFKITHYYDLEHARILRNSIRVGIGIDSHRFTEISKLLVLGGVVIQSEQGLEADSDGDVLLHALANALSSAIGGRSLGYYADDLCRQGITESRSYIHEILKHVKEKGYLVNNVGISVEAKRPRFDIYEERIKISIAEILGIDITDVGINSSSGDELSEYGRGNGIWVIAIAGLRKG